MTNLELDEMEKRIEEIEQIFDDNPNLDNDILENLNNELNEIISKLSEGLELETINELRKGFTVIH